MMQDSIDALTKESTSLRGKLAAAHQLAASKEAEQAPRALELASVKQDLVARGKEISRLMAEKAALRDSFDEELAGYRWYHRLRFFCRPDLCNIQNQLEDGSLWKPCVVQ